MPDLEIPVLVSKPKHTFNKAVDDALKECTDISNQRGGEYSDSWAIENMVTKYLDHTLRLIVEVDGNSPVLWGNDAKRLLLLASLCDVKVSRLEGPWKRDTFIDSINYIAAYVSLSEQYRTNSPPC